MAAGQLFQRHASLMGSRRDGRGAADGRHEIVHRTNGIRDARTVPRSWGGAGRHGVEYARLGLVKRVHGDQALRQARPWHDLKTHSSRVATVAHCFFLKI